ncbi:MAG: diguanylate cyclase [Gemmatimonadales bacterium]
MTQPAPQFQVARILVADDDAALLNTLRHILRGEGHEVTALPNGEEVLRHLEQETPDLLLLDIMMPRIDGLQLLERIRNDPRWTDMPVLMISSMPPEDATARALGLGADDFIAKPFRVKELIARVHARLRASRRMRTAMDEAQRHADEAQVQTEMASILHEITDTLKPDEIYSVLTRRVGRTLQLSRCSMVLAQSGDEIGLVVCASDNPNLRNLEIQLTRYPEIQRALFTGRPVLVKDVMTDSLYESVRAEWALEGVQVRTRSAIALPFALKDQQRGVFFLRTTEEDPPLAEEDVVFAGDVIRAAVTAIGKAHDLETAITERARFQELARTDALTGCVNRRALFERMGREMDRAKRYRHALAVILVDLDEFKRVNDEHGHVAGDRVLAAMGELLRRDARAVDIVGRYGGDEFILVLPETPLEGAVVFAERLRQRIHAVDFAEGGEPWYVSASIGVAGYPTEDVATSEDLIACADQAMYRAKHEGRNQVRQ